MVRVRSLSSVLLVFTSVVLAGPPLTAQRVLDSCSSVGVKATLERLFNDQPQWDALLAGVATGTPAWLEVATTLHAVSDAGSSEQLGSAVGEALEHRPANVLTLAIPNFYLEVVCGPPDVDDPRFDSYKLSMAAIERREAKLRSINKPSLSGVRDSCISELEKAKGDVSLHYKAGE
jgi:hypothetical protein